MTQPPDRATTARFFASHLIHRAHLPLTPRDWAGMADLFAEDALYGESTYGQYQGRPAIRRFLYDSFVGLEGWVFPMEWVEVGEGRVVVRLLNRAPVQRPDGSHYEFSSFVIVEYDAEGRIRRQTDAYDRLSAVRTVLAATWGGWRAGWKLLLGIKPKRPADL